MQMANEIVKHEESSAEAIVRVGGELEQLGREVEEIEARGISTGTDLVPTKGGSPVAAKQELGRLSALIAEKKEVVKAKRDELDDLLRAQLSATRKMLEPLEKMAAQLTEGIWTINLYLGRDEELIMLTDGEPADADEPITIRQMVLAMDQECAVAAETGGIDSISIEAFDDWLVEDPAHLDQVLPERKGVVALQPRFTDKRYSDPWKDAAAGAGNEQTYFLIRNGDKVYRTATDFKVGRRLVPASDEFTSFFVEQHRDWDTGAVEERRIEPGTDAWMKAEERADARGRHYMRVALILQGLVDRTTVFAPLPPEKVSFLDTADFEKGRVRFVMDGEDALGTGRESFYDWQRRLNSELHKGMRIIGSFVGEEWRESNERYDFNGRSVYGRHSRLSPENAEAPESRVVHVIEKRRTDGSFEFRYHRTEEIWDARKFEYRPPKTKATCVIRPEDRFILPFDLVAIEELEYYLSSRSERGDYIAMFPVIKAAIRAKREEAAAETPFRQLLVGQMVARNDVSNESAEAEVDDLISWWKFSTRTHRALVGADDAKALAGIVEEHAARIKDRARPVDGKLVAKLRDAHPGRLVIARKRDGAYVVLEASGAEDVYVDYFEYGARGKLKAQEDWKLLQPANVSRWQTIESSGRWEGWNWGGNQNTHLRGPETDELIGRLCDEYGPDCDFMEDDEQPHRLLAIGYDRERHTFYVHCLIGEAKREGGRLTGSLTEPKVRVFERGWKRAGNPPTLGLCRHSRWRGHLTSWRYNGKLPWEREGEPLFVDGEAVAEAERMRDCHAVLAGEREELRRRSRALMRQVERAWVEDAEEAAYERFMEDYGEPGLWEGHRKSLDICFPHGHRTDRLMLLFEHVAEAEKDVGGMTVAEVAAYAADELGVEVEVPVDVAAYVLAGVDVDEDEE